MTPTDQFIAQHVKLFMTWRHVDGFESQEEDPIDLEARMSGSCLPRCTLMTARCRGEGLEVVQLWVRANGVPHAVVQHVESGLVSDHMLAQPRTLERRLDLTDIWPLEKMLAFYADDRSNVSDV